MEMAENVYENSETCSVNEILFTKHNLPVVAKVIGSHGEARTGLPTDKDIFLDVVRDVEFIRVRLLDTTDVHYEEVDIGEGYVNILGSNKEFLIPAGYDGKLKFAQTDSKTYTTIAQVIDDLPRFVKVNENVKCSSTGRPGSCKQIDKNLKLELKWVQKTNGPDGQKRFLKLTCGKHVYTLSETQVVNMTAVADPLSYTIEKISRFVLLPAVIQFQQTEEQHYEYIYPYQATSLDKSVVYTTEIICGRPLKLLCFETHDVGVAVVDGPECITSGTNIALIPKGAGNQIVLLPEENSCDVYENTAFSTTIDNVVRRSPYVLDADLRNLTWLTKQPQQGFCDDMENRTCNLDLNEQYTPLAETDDDGVYIEMAFESTAIKPKRHAMCRPIIRDLNMPNKVSSSDSQVTFEEDTEYLTLDLTKTAIETNSGDPSRQPFGESSCSSHPVLSKVDYENAATCIDQSSSCTPDNDNLNEHYYSDSLGSDVSLDSTSSMSTTSSGSSLKRTEQEFYNYTVEEVYQCLKACHMETFAEQCKEQALDGHFFEELDLSLFEESPFLLTKFNVKKLARIIQNGWRPRI